MNILDKTINIEKWNGDKLFSFKIDKNGSIKNLEGCEVADIESDKIRIQEE